MTGLLYGALMFSLLTGAASCRRSDGAIPDSAIEACVAATVAASANPSLAEQAVMMASGCRGLYKEPRCRQAFSELGAIEPTARSEHIATACKQAYCPLLPNPKPDLCRNLSDSPQRLASQWPELQLAIWNRDLGAERTLALVAWLSRFNSLTETRLERLTLPPADPGAAAPQPRLRIDPEGFLVNLSSGEQWPIARCGSAYDRAALGEKLCRIKQTGRVPNTLMIGVSDQVAYGELVAAVDVATASGFTDVSVQDLSPEDALQSAPRPLVPARCGQGPAPCAAKDTPGATSHRIEIPISEPLAIERAPVLEVTADVILLNRVKVASTKDITGFSPKLESIVKALQAGKKELEQSTLSSEQKEELRSVLTLRAQPSVKFEVIKAVIYNAAVAGYGNLHFTVSP